MPHLPFSVFKRAGRRFFYVQFKNKQGKYLPAVSTKQTSEAAAIETAFKWYRDGKPTGDGGSIQISLKDTVRNITTTDEAEFICKELKRQGLLKTYVVSGSKQDINFPAYLENFWDYDSSPYVKEKLRKNHGIHRNYVKGQKLSVEKYWVPFFRGRYIGDITRQDIEQFIDDLASKDLSAGRRNIILKAGTIPLRWAFAKETIEKDITSGIVWFSGEAKERQILSPELAQAVFQTEWADKRAMLANLLSSVTGLRLGEIQGLRVQDLGKDCLYVRHSWNFRDGLKTTKNNTARTVEVPFPYIIGELLNLAKNSPHDKNMNGYVFWAEKSSLKPMEGRLIINGLRDTLLKIGMDEKSAAVYTFHGWRHFFTAYMKGRVADKLLQGQTGHRTKIMLDHYSGHLLSGDREKIRQAQMDVFGRLVPLAQDIDPWLLFFPACVNVERVRV